MYYVLNYYSLSTYYRIILINLNFNSVVSSGNIFTVLISSYLINNKRIYILYANQPLQLVKKE